MRFSLGILVLTAVIQALPVVSSAGHAKACISTDEALQKLNKEICLSAHVYDVVKLSDGTRFLDICPPETPDEHCRFTIVSLWVDHDQVGELMKYRNSDVKVRGVVRPMHGRAGLVLSHTRQFTGGPPRFKPNPKLLHGFGAEMERPPLSDPNLRSQGGRRAFMNTKDREPLPLK